MVDRVGQVPLSERDAAALVGWDRTRLTVLLDRVRAAARASGPPAALRAALAVIRAGLPGTAAGLGRRLQSAGLTTAVLQPAAVARLADLWGLPARVMERP